MVSTPSTRRAEKRKDRAPKYRRKAKASASTKDSISINSTKSKIRDVKRLLEHSQDLPPGVRIEKERALAGYHQDLEKAIEDKKRNEIIGRYHMVRFFERRKAERILKKARAQLAAGVEAKVEGGDLEGEWEELRKKVHLAEVDVNYAVYYPLTEKYVSLFPKSGDLKEGQEGAEPPRKPPVWAFVEHCMASGTLDMMRDGKYGVRPDGSVKTWEEYAPGMRSNDEVQRKEKGSGKSKAQNGEVDEKDSDGGFFEE